MLIEETRQVPLEGEADDIGPVEVGLAELQGTERTMRLEGEADRSKELTAGDRCEKLLPLGEIIEG